MLNASIEIPEDWQTISGAHFERQITVNLRSTLELLQALVPPMAERGWGRVLTIGSVQQVMPHPAMMVYAGTKAAQFNWVLNLARQYGGRGVTVNNLAPGAILHARNEAQIQREGAALAQRIPVGRLGAPDDLRARRCCCVPMPGAISPAAISMWMAGAISHDAVVA